MAGRFCQSCRCEPVTAGPPTCFCFGSLVRKNQNDSPPAPPPPSRGAGASRHQTGHRLGSPLVMGQAQEAAGAAVPAESRGGLAPGQGTSCPWGEVGRTPALEQMVLSPPPAHVLLVLISVGSVLLCCTAFTTPLTH